MHLFGWFVHNPVKVAVGVILVALFGLVSLTTMPMQLTPEVELPKITVTTRWLGASPQEVERDIIEKQEEQLASVEGMTKLSSQSMDSQGEVVLEFAVGTDMDAALVKVNARLQQVRDYPEDVEKPVISSSDASDRRIAWFILHPRLPSDEDFQKFLEEHPELEEPLAPVRATQNRGLMLYRLRRVAEKHEAARELLPPDVEVPKLRKFCEDYIEARFERVPGVSDSEVRGGREREMRVIVDPQQLAARQLTISDLRTALRLENQDTSAGDFWEGKRRWVVRTRGQFQNPKQIADTVLAYRDGNPVYVRDVARVELGHKKPDGLVRRYGESTIAINAARATGANVLEVMKGLREANEELNDGILRLRNLQLTQVYDETEYIYSSIDLVRQNIILGGLLTIAALLLFLRSGRSTLVIGLAIPVSIVGTFLVLSLLGRSLNVISLAGMAFAVGMLVDNAVVVLENIYRHWQAGEKAHVAAVHGAKEVWGAVLASTLTTLAVFIPVVFIQEQAGQLFRDIALAISSAVALSLIVSISVIPAASARLLRSGRKRGSGDESSIDEVDVDESATPQPGSLQQHLRRSNLFVRAVVGVNALLQKSTLLRLGTVAGFVGAALLLSYLMAPKVEYLPTGNRNLAIGLILPPPGYNLDTLMELGSEVENSLKPYWDIDADGAAEQTDHPAIGDFFFVARGRQVFLGLRAADPLKAAELVPLINEVGTRLEGGNYVRAFQSSLFEQGLTAGRTIDVEITGPDLDELIGLGGEVMGRVGGVIPDANAFPRPSLDKSSPEMHVRLKEQGHDMGLNSSDLGYLVDALVDGAYAGDYFTGGDTIDLTIVGLEQYVERTQDVRSLPIFTPSGDVVLLEAVAEVDYSSGPEQINHRERDRAITIQVTPPPAMPLEEAMDRIRDEIVLPMRDSGRLGDEYQIVLAGTADKLAQTWDALDFYLILAVLITYLLMAALFESWVYPFVIILSVPLGAVGGLAGLWLLNRFTLQPLDVLTMLGFVILIGIVVNNAILIVHQSLNYMRDAALPPREAVLHSVRTRIRPIFMTTTTTVLGLSPLVFMPGAGSELYQGLGSVVLGGLVVSTAFTLVLVPTLFSLTMDFTDWLRQRLALPISSAPSALQAEAAREAPATREEPPAPSGQGHEPQPVPPSPPDLEPSPSHASSDFTPPDDGNGHPGDDGDSTTQESSTSDADGPSPGQHQESANGGDEPDEPHETPASPERRHPR